MLTLLKNGMKAREPRRVVVVPSRMCVGSSWTSICIHNVSSRGLMAASDAPPPPGSYVEIRRGGQIIVGRSVWRNDRFFGVRTQDRIDIDALVSEPRLASRPAPKTERGEDRRATNRLAADAAVALRLERSRRFASAFQFALIVLSGAGAAGLIAMQVHHMLATSLALVAARLAA